MSARPSTNQPVSCTCCNPPAPLLPARAEGPEPRWVCATSTHPYAIRDGVLVALPNTPWDDTTAGATATHAVRIDLSREGYS